MLKSAAYTILKHIRYRWMFMLAFAAALAFLIAAYLTDSVAVAAVGAIMAYAAGEERAGQVLCNDCAVDLIVADPVLPDTYRVLERDR